MGLRDVERASLIEKIKQLKLDSLQTQERNGVTADTITVDYTDPV